ncbi:MAG: UDP-N-acetylmuramate:L-alanyl-gamma-D-glutamyl-meso-diaminopimelate ligase [Deltaproteobacteria bacterium]|nr:UDP-N-acetylmuramate:L-alanyl-gamma-D-glutamyl-meso-diaminopimelate ligase [Deltaproteobacteria bacterium]
MRTIHLVGIAGTGMGSFAGLLRRAGYEVRGSDENVYPPMSDKLAAWGIDVRTPYRPENLDPAPDLVIIGNVIRRTNPEAQAVVERGLTYTSFPKALGDLFLSKQHSVVVAGTHGKTTTTSLIAWLLTSAGRDPSLLVGGVPANFNEGFRLGQGAHFVVEGDEYDTAYFDKVPKFLHYHPRTLLVTSLEFDHADIYPNVEAIEREFEKVIALVPHDGLIIACASQPRVPPRLAAAKAPCVTYSARTGVDATWRAEEIELSPEGARFTVRRGREIIGRFFFPMSGLYNIENALGATAFATSAGLTADEIAEGFASFRGVARRQTVRFEVDGVRVIDDFAHHPTAVKETLEGLRARYPQGRLWAIFEPRSATSSRSFFQREYAEAFDAADEVIIAGVGRPEIPAAERLDIERLAADITARGPRGTCIAQVDDIVARLAREARPSDTLVLMSNGGFGGIYGKLEGALRAR